MSTVHLAIHDRRVVTCHWKSPFWTKFCKMLIWACWMLFIKLNWEGGDSTGAHLSKLLWDTSPNKHRRSYIWQHCPISVTMNMLHQLAYTFMMAVRYSLLHAILNFLDITAFFFDPVSILWKRYVTSIIVHVTKMTNLCIAPQPLIDHHHEWHICVPHVEYTDIHSKVTL